MKILLLLLSVLVLNKDCQQKQQTTAQNQNKEQVDSTANSVELSPNRLENYITLTYEVSSRGLYEKLWIDKDSIHFSTDRSNRLVSSTTCPQADWEVLMTALQKLKLGNLNEIDVPSKAFQYDGAAMATLKVQDYDVIFSSPIFDHGNPPEQIAEVVKKMLYMKDTLEKD